VALEYRVKRGDTIGHVAEWYGVRASDIRNWNDIAYGSVVRAGEDLRIWVDPARTASLANVNTMSFAEKQEMLEKGQKRPASPPPTTTNEAPSNNGPGWIRYLIKPGDTLESIAAQYSVSIDNLKNWNGLRTSRINAGGSLDIYTEPEQRVRVIPTKPSQGAVKTNGTAAEAGKTHTVRRGETLGAIAERYGTDVAALKQANGLSSSRIDAGQRLRIPGGDRASNDYITYRVRKGDSLWKISQAYGVPLSELQKHNTASEP